MLTHVDPVSLKFARGHLFVPDESTKNEQAVGRRQGHMLHVAIFDDKVQFDVRPGRVVVLILARGPLPICGQCKLGGVSFGVNCFS